MKVQLPDQRGKPGEPKAPERELSMTFLVLGETLKVFSTVRRIVQFAGYFKTQAHCLRLGRLAPLRLTFRRNPKSGNPKFLSAFPNRRPFFDKGFWPFLSIFGLHHHALEIGLVAQTLFQRHFAAFINGFFDIAQRQGRAL